MKCPLMPNKDYSEQLEKKLHPGDCLKEECAWWDLEYDRCAILRLAGELGTLNDLLPPLPN